jgi:hypothetical protein
MAIRAIEIRISITYAFGFLTFSLVPDDLLLGATGFDFVAI